MKEDWILSTCPTDEFVGGACVFMCSGVGITYGARPSRMCSSYAGGGLLPLVLFEVECGAPLCRGSQVSCCIV